MDVLSFNSAQKEAIEYNAGPLLIVAGAGTGKTTVITKKIAYLLEQKLAEPKNILALTFTEKAAEEMLERVDQLVNIDYTDMQISTFHAFCQRLLENYGLDIGLSNQFKILTQTDAWLLVRKHLDKFDLDYYRPLGNPARHIHELIKHFSKCKDELITPANYLKHAEEVMLESMDVNVDEKSRLTEIANAYHAYNQLLLDNNSLDFGDLIFYAIQLLQKRPQILQKLRERFKYILIDEFQDVNWSQYQLVRMLGGVLTVVGDDDQSVYAFRGASVSNILRFKDDYPQAKEIILTENYRSGQEILDMAYKLIQNNNPDRLETKLNIDKELKSKAGKSKSVIEHIHCSNFDEEVRTVIEKISEIHEKKMTVWDDFAILVRANAHAEPFIDALQKRGIPYEFLASSGLYKQPIVIDALNFFKAIDNYHESGAIYRLLQLPCWNFSSNDSQKLSYFAHRKSIGFYEALKRSGELKLSEIGQKNCQRLLTLINTGMQNAREQKPTMVLYQFLESSGYLQFLTHEEGQGNMEVIRHIHQLRQFFDNISEFETAHADARARDFLEHYNYIVEAGDEGTLSSPEETADSVNIMTVHRAKGLEFKYVFIVNLVEDRFPTRRKSDGIEVPLPLIKEHLPEGDYHLEEERRLFYVAITRAKERLFLTSAESYGGARKKKISRFLSELNFDEQTIQPSNHKAMVKWPNGQIVKNIDKQNSAFLASNIFSYSQINSYQRCPYQYKLAHVLNIPTKGNASFSFGQTMHSALQQFYTRLQELNSMKQDSLFGSHNVGNINRDNTKAPTLEELLAFYEKNWQDDWYESKRQREDYYKKGKEILKIFYASQEGNWNMPAVLERGFKIKIGDYVLNGRIDRVDVMPDGKLEIIDYKTGQSKEKITGDDKDQLLIYQIAAQTLPEYKNIGEVKKLTFYYLNDNIRTSFIGKEEESEKMLDKILNVIEKIRSGDFTPAPSRHVCSHCDFKGICEFREL